MDIFPQIDVSAGGATLHDVDSWSFQVPSRGCHVMSPTKEHVIDDIPTPAINSSTLVKLLRAVPRQALQRKQE